MNFKIKIHFHLHFDLHFLEVNSLIGCMREAGGLIKLGEVISESLPV